MIVMVALTLSARAATAQEPDIRFENVDALAVNRPPFVSLDALDVTGRSRFHLTARMTFDDGTDTFSKSTRAAFELLTALRLTDGLAVVALLPFATEAPNPGPNEFYIGNFRVGVHGGKEIALPGDPTDRNRPHLFIGAGLDVYAPTAPTVTRFSNRLVDRAFAPIAAIRSYEPELYIPKLMTFRPRVQGDFRVNMFAAQLELGLAPGFIADRESRFMMFFHWLLRIAVQPTRWIEPFLELGSTPQIAGVDVDIAGIPFPVDYTTPVLLTLGARGHFGPVSPALFVGLDLANGTPIFGIDLAGLVTSNERGVVRGEDPFDF